MEGINIPISTSASATEGPIFLPVGTIKWDPVDARNCQPVTVLGLQPLLTPHEAMTEVARVWAGHSIVVITDGDDQGSLILAIEVSGPLDSFSVAAIVRGIVDGSNLGSRLGTLEEGAVLTDQIMTLMGSPKEAGGLKKQLLRSVLTPSPELTSTSGAHAIATSLLATLPFEVACAVTSAISVVITESEQ